MVRHNPELVSQTKEKKKKPVEKREEIIPLEEMRRSIYHSVFRKGSNQWTNEVPNNVRSQLEKGRANPTIGLSILS